MENENQPQFPRQSLPEEQPPLAPITPSNDTAAAPPVPGEYEPATERPQYTPQADTPAPLSSPDFGGSQPMSTSQEPTPKKSKKGLIAILIAVVLVAILGGGAFAAYKLWYQNPQKVMSDAVTNAIKARTIRYTGNMTADFSGGKIALDLSGAQASLTSGDLDVKATITYQGQNYKVNGSAMIDKDGTLFVKLSNLHEIFQTIMKQYGADTTTFDAFITKVDDRWIKITPDDFNNLDKTTNTTKQCVTNALKKLNTDKSVRQEIANTYKEHPFINIDNNLGSQTIDGQDSMGYTITSDKAKEKDFTTAFNNTQFAKDLQKCDKNNSFNSSDFNTSPSKGTTSTTQVWVSRWGHEFTRLKVDSTTGGNKASLTLNPVFNMAVSIETPKDSLTVKEVQDEFTKAIDSFSPATPTDSSGSSGVSPYVPLT